MSQHNLLKITHKNFILLFLIIKSINTPNETTHIIKSIPIKLALSHWVYLYFLLLLKIII
jgi:hypothetical protein